MRLQNEHYWRLELDRQSPQPLYRQIAEAVRRAIASGALASGVVIPSTRALAAHLSVSRNTVVTAYDELHAEGLLEARRGSVVRVRATRARPAFDWGVLLRDSRYPVLPVRFLDPENTPLYTYSPKPIRIG
jgi:DNA-binding transcriptional MocR family regulator